MRTTRKGLCILGGIVTRGDTERQGWLPRLIPLSNVVRGHDGMAAVRPRGTAKLV